MTETETVSIRFRTYRRVVLATLALVAGVVAVNPLWAQVIGVDVWNLPAIEQSIDEQAELSEKLDGESDDVMRLIAVKQTLVAELATGQTTLDEVTTEFLALSADRSGDMLTIRTNFPGRTDRERVARSVISYARSQAGSPAVADEVGRRLEVELAAMTAESQVAP